MIKLNIEDDCMPTDEDILMIKKELNDEPLLLELTLNVLALTQSMHTLINKQEELNARLRIIERLLIHS